MDKISITVLRNGLERKIETKPNEYKNLMFLLKDHCYPDDFGECGGMGRCATCIIKASGLKGAALEKDRNEPATLEKFRQSDPNLRLACGLHISSDLEGAIIELIEI
ncbi:2Fe-2S iron-sulfur cluster-binding protein [Arcticibacterium luteifluviistationis]|uniref:Ferredoxin n=1 Tax=Arcticibacterium luteifluviistationis TaxID=1784714 RepID=A0A2Z4GBZ3_9BACT|nr:2Fe-2S iron-sulfur cluster-binding protein [Arcticibacterium luteifluviistationis]AWV98812.1 ferredoxin [Arcticibacterium luteifluviistationis]